MPRRTPIRTVPHLVLRPRASAGDDAPFAFYTTLSLRTQEPRDSITPTPPSSFVIRVFPGSLPSRLISLYAQNSCAILAVRTALFRKLSLHRPFASLTQRPPNPSICSCPCVVSVNKICCASQTSCLLQVKGSLHSPSPPLASSSLPYISQLCLGPHATHGSRWIEIYAWSG